MKIYNSLTKKKEEFAPITKGEVKMYVCGVTPYDYAHIGNARPAIVFDTLYRFLKAQGHKVTYVRNFTDVDDKIIKRANELGLDDWKKLPKEYIGIYHNDMQRLNVLGSSEDENILEPRVTEHIEDIIKMVKTLLDKDIAYIGKSGDVLYDTTKFADYGALSGNTLEQLQAGQRVAVSEDKRNPTDFVLWKSTKVGEPMSWEFNYEDKDGNKVNAGRPGWHIECSAMALEHLGESFDIHGGGEDLKFPHHECEIAQSKGACGGDHARYWMHNAFINIDGEKMSKSLGNFKTINSLLEKYSGEAIRLWMLSTHYRKPLDLTEEALERAERKVRSWFNASEFMDMTGKTAEVDKLNHYTYEYDKHKAFELALSNDLNTPQAIAVVESVVGDINLAKQECRASDVALAQSVLGSFLLRLGVTFEDYILQINRIKNNLISSSYVESMIEMRNNAKENKDWATADDIRNKLKVEGIVLEDGPNGTTWRKA